MTRFSAVRWTHVSTFLLLLYWAALMAGTHLPGSAVPATPVSDKSLHFMAFLGLGFLLAWTWTTRRPFLPVGAFVAVLIAVAYAAIDEITQAFIPGRFADVVDWYYDVAGTIAGTTIFCAVDWLFRRVFRGSGRQVN
ncbi:MAG: VanZ family protein [Pirellulaceae bacterium]